MKLKRFPKRPRASAPLSTWERYEDKIQEVKKFNAALEASKRKKKSIIDKTSKAIKK